MEKSAQRVPQSMKTIDKAMTLLGFFTTEMPEYRLSDIARAASVDKATAMRILNSLASGGLVEQHPETKKYRLGTAVLRLARIRETSFPLISVLQPIVDQLAETTGESAHACLASDAGLTHVALCEPNRATRVWLDPSQVLPFHATASGIAYMAFAKPEIAMAWLKKAPTRRFTEETITGSENLLRKLEDTRRRGISVSVGSLETDVTGIAAPVFDWHRRVFATVAVACVRSRLTPDIQKQIETKVLQASAAATRAFGGQSPGKITA